MRGNVMNKKEIFEEMDKICVLLDDVIQKYLSDVQISSYKSYLLKINLKRSKKLKSFLLLFSYLILFNSKLEFSFSSCL